MTLLSVEGLSIAYGRGGMAVEGVDLDLRRGEILGLVGESGCGKSTVAFGLLRLLPPGARIAAGHVRYGALDLAALPEAQLRALRGNRIAMIFQNPMTALDPAMRIGPQIVETIRTHEPGTPPAAAGACALALLRDVGIPAPAERLRAYPHELSGGMRQRVALAIALSCNPDVLIADEPTTALDVTIQAQILSLIRDLTVRARGAGVLLITHDLGVVAQVCDRVAVMYAGRIVETGPVAAVLGAPRHPYTAALIASAPAPDVPRGRLATIEGRVPPPGARPPGCAFRPRCRQARPACADPAAPPHVTLGPDRAVACLLHADG